MLSWPVFGQRVMQHPQLYALLAPVVLAVLHGLVCPLSEAHLGRCAYGDPASRCRPVWVPAQLRTRQAPALAAAVHAPFTLCMLGSPLHTDPEEPRNCGSVQVPVCPEKLSLQGLLVSFFFLTCSFQTLFRGAALFALVLHVHLVRGQRRRCFLSWCVACLTSQRSGTSSEQTSE